MMVPTPEASTTPVLVADRDATVVSLLTSALERAGFSTRSATDAESAMRLAKCDPVPRLALVDVTLVGEDRRWIGSPLRREQPFGELYLFALASMRRHRDPVFYIDAGADEFVTKPVDPIELVARVRWAHEMVSRLTWSSRQLMVALREALASAGGELVVRGDQGLGRVYIHDGKIAWATISTRPTKLASIFDGAAKLSRDDVRSVLEDSRLSQKNVVDVIVERGLAPRGVAREALRRWIQTVFSDIFALTSPRLLFVPVSRPSWGGPKFSLNEVVHHPTLHGLSAVVANQRVGSAPIRCQHWDPCGSCRDAVEKLEHDVRVGGAAGVALIHRSSGVVMGAAGEPIDPGFVRAQLALLGTLDDEQLDEVLVSGGSKHYLLRGTGCVDAFVCLMGTKEKLPLGALRHEIARTCERVVPGAALTRLRSARAITEKNGEKNGEARGARSATASRSITQR